MTVLRASLQWRAAGWLSLVFLAAGAGCSDPDGTRSFRTYEVKGIVLLADGRPLSGGRILLESTQELAHVAEGSIGPDGSFTLATPNVGEGAAPGEYKVWIEPAAGLGTVKKGGAIVRDANSYPFAAQFADPDSSGLTAVVKPEPNQ